MSTTDDRTTDPTGTATLRERFARDLRSRLRDLRGANREYLTDRGAQQLSARRLRAYRSWFTSTALDTLVEPEDGGSVARGTHWTATYVRQAYDKGLRDARTDLRRAGDSDSVVREATSTSTAAHSEHRRQQYLSAYYELEDLAYSLRNEAFRAANEALTSDASTRQLAADANARIKQDGENSANALANTVVVETVNEAKLTSYELSEEVEEIGFTVEPAQRQNAHRHNAGEVQFTTAGDAKVCPECAVLAGTTLTVEEARGKRNGTVPPIHPNCRCYLTIPDTNLDITI